MALSVDRIVSNPKVASNLQKAGSAINAAVAKLGEKYEKSGFSKFFNNTLDPRGGNNSFMGLAALMAFGVITPRIVTALKRNPDNHEATIDEIKEILFRDVQSVLIVLFMLKTANSLIDSLVSKKSGLPLLSKPYQKLFDDSIKGFGAKVADFFQHPAQKLKIIGQNIKDALHPTGGCIAKTNNEYVADFSNYSWQDLSKFFPWINKRGGSDEKVFNIILDGAIEKYENILNGVPKKGIPGVIDKLKASINKSGNPLRSLEDEKVNIEATLEQLKKLKGQNPKVLDELKGEEQEAVRRAITDLLADKDNPLVQAGKGTNSWLRLGALALEASYLGFGIPALNQLRLEKKYLREHKNDPKQPSAAAEINTYGSSLINKNIKAHQVKLYHDFIKQ